MTWERRYQEYRFASSWWFALALLLLGWMSLSTSNVHRAYGRRFDWMAQEKFREFDTHVQNFDVLAARIAKQYPAPPPEFPPRRR